MGAPRRRHRRPGPALLGLVAMLGFTFCGYADTDVWCNEAVAHLAKCCPGFDASLYACEPASFPLGCEDYSFDVEAGKAITRRSCQELRALGDCDSPFAALRGGAR